MPTPNKPTLIIGLGGLGSKIVEKVYRQFAAGPRSDIDKRNVAFLCMDTDEADVNNRRKVMPDECVVKTSSDLSATVGGYIDSIKNSTDVLKWFDISNMHLNGMPLNKGAAQIRMASRLALMSAIKEGKLVAIDNSIDKLLAVEPERHQGNIIRVIIVTSLAGGTGAGSFLQTAYYVKNAMRSKGIAAPEIEGYFLLADVLCDSEKGKELNDDQKENMRSNTYACMKELMAFSRSDRGEGLKDIEFEYRMGQRDKSLPVDRPYYQCFLVDYTAASGENLGKLDAYCKQVESFVYLQAFSPEGDQHRSNAINDMRRKLRADGQNMFNALGVSRLVYPVDDLFAYFARQRVVDNMRTSWCSIDKEFREELASYRKDVREGIPHKKPEKGQFFMDKVEALAQNSGSIGAEFKEIYRSTQIYDERQNLKGTKAQEYFQEVQAKVRLRVQDNGELKDLAKECGRVPINFTTQDLYENDGQTVRRVEDALNDFWNRALTYIDSTKRSIAHDCFLNDHEAENYVSKNPEEDKHHLNTVILQKDEEMHPLAVRYFLYDLKLNCIMPLLNKKKAANERLRGQIDNYFTRDYNPETKDHKESAAEGLVLAKGKNGGVKQVTNWVSGRNPYRDWKKQYVTDSSAQAGRIKTYITEKLLEETLSNLQNYVNRLLEESENFFDGLPDALFGVDQEREALLNLHEGSNDRSVTYVLASAQNKKDIYDFVISNDDSAFFPTVMSAALYRSMYHNAVVDLGGEKYATSKKPDPEARKKAVLEANTKILQECVAYQEKLIREKNRDYATKNVIAALKEEAEREMGGKGPSAKAYMEKKFNAFRDQARIWGPNDLGNDTRYINAWGFHPVCIQPGTLTPTDADALFGDENVFANPENAATRLPSDSFSPFEVIRASSVTCLSINRHFKKFHERERTELSDEYFGPYFVAYRDVVDRVFKSEKKTRAIVTDDEVAKEVTVHLDKHWHLPAYMPNIGSTSMEETKKLFKALSYGLLLDCFKAIYNGGQYYWKYVRKTTMWIRDEEKLMVGIGQTLPNALNILFETGLVNNPGIVEDMLQYIEEKWKDAREEWLDTEHDENDELEKMKGVSLIKKMTDFKFNLCSPAAFQTEKNWFAILDARRGSALKKVLDKNDGELITYFFKDLVEHIIGVFGQNSNTLELCNSVVAGVGESYKDYPKLVLEDFVEKHRFEPLD